jgi:hypothetical protein
MFKKISEIIDTNMDTVTNNSFLFIITANKCIQEERKSTKGQTTIYKTYTEN